MLNLKSVFYLSILVFISGCSTPLKKAHHQPSTTRHPSATDRQLECAKEDLITPRVVRDYASSYPDRIEIKITAADDEAGVFAVRYRVGRSVKGEVVYGDEYQMIDYEGRTSTVGPLVIGGGSHSHPSPPEHTFTISFKRDKYDPAEGEVAKVGFSYEVIDGCFNVGPNRTSEFMTLSEE